MALKNGYSCTNILFTVNMYNEIQTTVITSAKCWQFFSLLWETHSHSFQNPY